MGNRGVIRNTKAYEFYAKLNILTTRKHRIWITTIWSRDYSTEMRISEAWGLFSPLWFSRLVSVSQPPRSRFRSCLVYIIIITGRWHVTISCQPDGRPPLSVRPWKSGRVHLAEGSNIVVLEQKYVLSNSTQLNRRLRTQVSDTSMSASLIT